MGKMKLISIIAVLIIFGFSIIQIANKDDEKKESTLDDKPSFKLSSNVVLNKQNTVLTYDAILNKDDFQKMDSLSIHFNIPTEKRIDEDNNNIYSTINKTSHRKIEYISNSGYYLYRDTEKSGLAFSSKIGETIPTDTECVSIANDILTANGLMGNGLEFSEVKYNFEGFAEKGSDIPIEEWIYSKKVYFTTNLNGIKLEGAGGKTTVTIGENGKIKSFMAANREFESNGQMNILSHDDAFAKLENGESIIEYTNTMYNNREIYIDDSDFCYYLESIYDSNPIPCYYFKGKFTDSNDDFVGYVDASK